MSKVKSQMPNASIATLVAMALAFFYATAWLGTPPNGVWNSPDETANAFWAGRVALREPLLVRDLAVGLGAGAVHPRSFAVNGTALVPGSFPGLFLIYGALAFLFKLPLSAMTPLLTAAAGFVLYALVRRLFDRRAAFWTALLFWAHPAVLYYSARGLFHNLLLVDLLIFAAGFLVLRPFSGLSGSRGRLDDALAGVFIGLAVMTRASEAVWFLPSALVLLPFFDRKERWRRLLAAAAGAALPVFILLNLNASLYGDPFRSGYVAPPAVETADFAADEAGGSSNVKRQMSNAVGTALPFGFHPRLVLLHGWQYGLGIFWWYSALALLGAAVFLAGWKGEPRSRRAYFVTAIGIGAWLLVLYGSWHVRDHWDPTRVTIGTSYVRYFLPAYVMTLPFAASGLVWLSDRFGRREVAAILAAAMLVLSVQASVVRGDEAMLAVRETLRGNAAKKAEILPVIPEDAVIMTGRFDKVFFPERMRFIPSSGDAAFETAAMLKSYFPVFWYGIEPPEEELAALKTRLLHRGFLFGEVGRHVDGDLLLELVDPSEL